MLRQESERLGATQARISYDVCVAVIVLIIERFKGKRSGLYSLLLINLVKKAHSVAAIRRDIRPTFEPTALNVLT